MTNPNSAPGLDEDKLFVQLTLSYREVLLLSGLTKLGLAVGGMSGKELTVKEALEIAQAKEIAEERYLIGLMDGSLQSLWGKMAELGAHLTSQKLGISPEAARALIEEAQK